jgi:ABC-type spermidine/putrescine transport system permease subunit II
VFRRLPVYLVAIAVVGVTVVPLLFTLFGGFRTNAQINESPAGWPHPWTLDNYKAVLSTGYFWRLLGNSTLIAVVVTALTVALGSMAAYALSRYTFKGREFTYTLFTIGLLFPLTAAALPLYLLLRQLSLLENPIGVALPEAAFALPITIVILRPFMRAVPGEIEDAAAVDGASRLGFFWRIQLERLSVAAAGVQRSEQLHPAPRRRDLPDAILPGSRADPGLHGRVDDSGTALLRLRRTPHRRRTERLGEGVGGKTGRSVDGYHRPARPLGFRRPARQPVAETVAGADPGHGARDSPLWVDFGGCRC